MEYDSPNTHHKFPPLVTHTLYITDTGTIQQSTAINSTLLYLFKTLLVIIHVLLRLMITLPFLSFSKNKWYALHNSKCTNILSIWLLERLSDKKEETLKFNSLASTQEGLPCEMQQQAREYIWQRLFWISSGTLLRFLHEVDSFIFCPTCLFTESYSGLFSAPNSDLAPPVFNIVFVVQITTLMSPSVTQKCYVGTHTVSFVLKPVASLGPLRGHKPPRVVRFKTFCLQ